MKPKKYSSEAIVLARRNFSETDRILAVFSKSYGKLSLIAKGVRKLKSRKRGHLEVFSYVKLSASRGKNLDILTEVELIDPFSSVRENLKKASVAYFFVETVGRLTREGVANERVFSILKSYLKRLGIETKLKELRLNFVFELLTILGFWPRNKKMNEPDKILEEVTERQMTSIRVGKKVLS